MTWNGNYYNGYAYFDNSGEAYNFMMEAYNGTQYLDYYMGDNIEYCVYWEMWHYENGYWNHIHKK